MAAATREATVKAPDYQYTPEFAELLEFLGISLVVSTYQAGKIVAVRPDHGRLSVLLRTFPMAMGLAHDSGRLAVGTRYQVWVLRHERSIAAQLQPPGRHDACFVPRYSHVTGDIGIHEVAWGQGKELWLVNTRFSCLCTLDESYSFVPRWQPPFVSALAAEDRCHLNGLTMVDGQPRYVTALGETDTPGGWRAQKASGGCVLDVVSGAIVARGLCMPHSPRVHDGRLWLLASGAGQVNVLDPANGKLETVAQLPGYTRGLCLQGRYAFVCLSKIRETSSFGGLPIGDQAAQLQCGVWALDVHTGQTIGSLVFPSGIEELFDVQALPGVRFPEIIGFEEETIQGIFVVPGQRSRKGPPDSGDRPCAGR